MKKFKKVMIAGLAAVMAVGVMSSFAACGGKKTELIVNTMFGGGDGHEYTFRQVNAQFRDANPEIKLTDRSGNPTGDPAWTTNFVADLTSRNNKPDVVYFFAGAQMKPYQDQLVKVADIAAAYPGYGKNVKLHDTDEYSLELKGTTVGFMYNAKMTADVANYDAVSTFLAGQKGKADSLNARPDVPHYWFNYLMCRELGIVDFNAFDGTKAFFTTDVATKWKAAFNKVVIEMRKIGFGGSTNGAALAAGNEATFFTGNGGSALLDGSWSAGNIVADSGVKVVALPAKTGDLVKVGVGAAAVEKQANLSMGGFTQGWFITKKAWNDPAKQKLAVDYVMRHTSDVAISEYCRTAGGLASNGQPIAGASEGAQAFVSMVNEPTTKLIVAADDRTNSTAKGTLLTDWTLDHPFAMMLIAVADPAQTTSDNLFDAFIAAL